MSQNTNSQGFQLKAQYPLYLANEAVETTSWLEVTDKYSNQVVSRVAQADAKILDQAIAAAVQAEKAMAALKPFEKQEILLHCVKRFKERSDELAQILVIEGGKPLGSAKAEVLRLISTFQLAADAVTQLNQGVVMPLAVTEAAANYRGMTQRVPVGAVSLISPFNFPLNLTAHKIAPAIVAGCPFVLKPAS